MSEIRSLLVGFKRQLGYSNAALAAKLGTKRDGPSASTLSRFLVQESFGGELSIRHLRIVLARLGEVVEQSGEDPEIARFTKENESVLRRFNLLRSGFSKVVSFSEIASRQDVPEDGLQLSGEYALVRRSKDSRFIMSIAVFDAATKKNACRIFKLQSSNQDVYMDCGVIFANRMLYASGWNQLNETMRFMCFTRYGLGFNVLNGVLSGFEMLGAPFSAKAALIKISDRVEVQDHVDQLEEEYSIEALSKFCDTHAFEAQLAMELAQKHLDDGYLFSNPRVA